MTQSIVSNSVRPNPASPHPIIPKRSNKAEHRTKTKVKFEILIEDAPTL